MPDISTLVGEVKDLIVSIKDEQDDTTEAVAKLSDTVNDITQKFDETQKWIKEVEEKLNTRRFEGGQRDALIDAIPERFRRALYKAERAPSMIQTFKKDPVRRIACETWMKLVIRMQLDHRNSQRYAQELEVLEKALGFDAEARAAMQEDTSSEGGYLVPTPLEAELLRLIADTGIVRQLARTIAMGSKTLDIPNLATGVTVSIVAEEGIIGESEPTFGQTQLVAKKFAARGLVSRELLEDSALGIADLYLTLCAEKIGAKEDDEALEGDGTNFTGLVSATGVNEVTNGIDGASPSYAKLVNQKWAAAQSQSRRGAAWVMHPTIAGKIEALVDGNSRPIWSNPTAGNATLLGNANAASGLLLGFPAFTTDQISITRTVGASTDCSNIYFGPFRLGMIFGDRTGVTFGLSEHVAWNTDQIALKVTKRTAIVVGVPSAFTKQTGVKSS